MLVLQEGARWRIVTFEDGDFDPGFSTELAPDREHVLQLAVFADNASTATCALVASVRVPDGAISVRLAEQPAPAAGQVGPVAPKAVVRRS